MGKQTLHGLIDLLPESDTDTIYKILLKFIPTEEPLPDEIEAIRKGHEEKASGEVENLDNIDWD